MQNYAKNTNVNILNLGMKIIQVLTQQCCVLLDSHPTLSKPVHLYIWVIHINQIAVTTIGIQAQSKTQKNQQT